MNTKNTSSGRPRSFNEESALIAAMEAFWANGYTDTNYPALEEATGLRRQSIIYAFGDKKSLFEKALRLYVSHRVERVIAILHGSERLSTKLDKVFDIWASDASSKAHSGCLLVNTTGEIGQKSQIIASIAAKSTRDLASAFESAFSMAKKKGEMPDKISSEALADIFVSAGDGALLHARASGNGQSARETFSRLLLLIE